MLLIQLTGMPSSGKSTVSILAKDRLLQLGHKVEVVDGDDFRKTLSKDLGFSKEDRIENIRRLGIYCNALALKNIIVIMAAINPYELARHKNKQLGAHVKTVWIKCGLEELIKRDTKGLYARALLPNNHPKKLNNFTGISDPYETPNDVDLIINTEQETFNESSEKLVNFILNQLS